MPFILNKHVVMKVVGAAFALAGAVVLGACGKNQPAEIGVYSGRHYNTDKSLYQRFTEETGIQVKLLEAKDDALIERLNTEGDNAPADVLILADAARLDRAASMNLFQPVNSASLNQSVPEDLRDGQNRWFGLTRRLRAPMFNADLIQADQVSSYAALSAPALKGKLCLRNRRSVYNQSLVAFMLDEIGEPRTTNWIKGMVANLAQPVFSSDTPMIRAVAQGQCGVALANSYYLGRMQAGDKGEADQNLGQKVSVRWPDPVHVNITGGGVTRVSRNPEAARRFLEFLSSKQAQGGYAAANHEYPLEGMGEDPVLKAWGPFTQAKVSAARLGELNARAVELMAANGWD